MKKQLGIVAVGLAGLAAGAGAGFVLTGATGAAGASGTAAPTTTTSAPNSSAPATTTAPNQPNGQQGTNPKADRTQKLKKILDPLVKNGTITQAQENAVIAALQKAGPAIGNARPPFGGRGPLGRFGRLDLDAAAKAIGISTSDLQSALRSGQSIAQVATAHKVSVDKVVAAMMAPITQRASQAVTSGRITQSQADKLTAAAKTAITAIVNGQRPAFHGPGMPPAAGGRPNAPDKPNGGSQPKSGGQTD
jgi:hypothetical protein